MTNVPQKFIFRPTMLLCDGSNIWEVASLSKEEMHKAVDGDLDESTWKAQEWRLVTPRGCQTCNICTKLRLHKPPPPGYKRCLKCDTYVHEWDWETRCGFCHSCDLEHYEAWHSGTQETCFSEYREEMQGNYEARLNNSFARDNGLGCSI